MFLVHSSRCFSFLNTSSTIPDPCRHATKIPSASPRVVGTAQGAYCGCSAPCRLPQQVGLRPAAISRVSTVRLPRRVSEAAGPNLRPCVRVKGAQAAVSPDRVPATREGITPADRTRWVRMQLNVADRTRWVRMQLNHTSGSDSLGAHAAQRSGAMGPSGRPRASSQAGVRRTHRRRRPVPPRPTSAARALGVRPHRGRGAARVRGSARGGPAGVAAGRWGRALPSSARPEAEDCAEKAFSRPVATPTTFPPVRPTRRHPSVVSAAIQPPTSSTTAASAVPPRCPPPPTAQPRVVPTGPSTSSAPARRLTPAPCSASSASTAIATTLPALPPPPRAASEAAPEGNERRRSARFAAPCTLASRTSAPQGAGAAAACAPARVPGPTGTPGATRTVSHSSRESAAAAHVPAPALHPATSTREGLTMAALTQQHPPSASSGPRLQRRAVAIASPAPAPSPRVTGITYSAAALASPGAAPPACETTSPSVPVPSATAATAAPLASAGTPARAAGSLQDTLLPPPTSHAIARSPGAACCPLPLLQPAPAPSPFWPPPRSSPCPPARRSEVAQRLSGAFGRRIRTNRARARTA